MIYARPSWGCVICLVAMLILSGCAGIFSHERVQEELTEDVKMAMNIKSKLFQEKDLQAAAIHVEAQGGVVQLSGFVETESQRRLASAIARNVLGVQQVNNRIEIK